MHPLISILMPVYNGGAYLREAMQSVLTQSFRDFELIVINDGSTDNSRVLLEEFVGVDSRVHLVSRENQGLVATLNEALHLAHGKYCARMDQDDLSLSHRLATQLAFLETHPDCVLVGSQVIFIDPDGDEIGPKQDMRSVHEEIDAALMAGEWPIVHPAVMMRTEAIRRVGGYHDYDTWEDHDLFLRMAEVGRLENLQESLLKYRLHLGSMVHQRAALKSNVLAKILSDARERRGLPPLDDKNTPQYRGLTSAEHQRNWVWWSLASCNTKTARKHAWGALRNAPLEPESWRALYCSMRGR